MNALDIILKKRGGEELSTDEIRYFIEGYTKGEIPDYQASALLMAVYFNGMTKRETFDLTEVMRTSGDVMDLSRISGVKVDKHSTGGVGDKVSLCVAPVAAACGVKVAKMSGRMLAYLPFSLRMGTALPCRACRFVYRMLRIVIWERSMQKRYRLKYKRSVKTCSREESSSPAGVLS